MEHIAFVDFSKGSQAHANMPVTRKRDAKQEQLLALVLKYKKESGEGKTLVQLLQDAVAKDDVDFFCSLRETCLTIEEGERQKGATAKANNAKASEEVKSAHERFCQLLNPPGLKDTTLLILAIQTHSSKVRVCTKC